MVSSKRLAVLIIIVFTAPFFKAQTFPKFWIQLKDKSGTPYSISTPTAFLTPKSVLRRTTYNIPVTQSDLPVTPTYISLIDGVADVRVIYASKWLNAVAIEVTNLNTTAISTATNAVNSFSFVQGSNPTNKLKVVFEKEIEPDLNSGMNRIESSMPLTVYGGAYWQAKQLRVDCIHYHGYRGQGMTIAVLDAGFQNANSIPAFDSLFARGGVLGTRDFVAGGNSVYEDNSHGTLVLSCISGLVPNVLVGTAPRADVWLLRTEDASTETPSEEYNWIRGAEFADSVGADILTTSLGYTTFDKSSYNHNYSGLNGKTYPMSIAATMAARKGMFVLNSAGNDGAGSWQFIGVPADADSICSVGAIDSLGSVAAFSSKGPTSDGRIKPDLCARGANAYVANTSGGYGPANGTSFSCPILAGAVACFWQKHTSFNNMKVLDTLRKSASNHVNPNNTFGWGVPDMCFIPVGLKELSKAPDFFNTFPNPFTNNITVQLTDKISDATIIELFDVRGKLLKTVKPNSTDTVLDVSTFAAGIYFIKVNSKLGSSTQKIVKE